MNCQNDTRPAMLAAALECAARSWPVLPVPPRSKKGWKSEGHSGGRRWGATIDSDEIRRDWTRWPDANVGVVCGAESGFLVVEADTVAGHGVDGIAAMHALIEQHGPLPDTIETLSLSGSWHIYFRWSQIQDIRNSAGQIAPGIGVRGNGGVVVAPPSVKPGAALSYHWKKTSGLLRLGRLPRMAASPRRPGGERAEERARGIEAQISRPMLKPSTPPTAGPKPHCGTRSVRCSPRPKARATKH
jgi:hypothetical protein